MNMEEINKIENPLNITISFSGLSITLNGIIVTIEKQKK